MASDTPIQDRIDEIMNTSQTEAVMEMTPDGALSYFVKEMEWKAAALKDMRAAMESWIAKIDQKIDYCRNAAEDFRKAREVING